MTDLQPIQRAAVVQAVRRTRRLYTTDPEDRFQDAAEAVLRATPRLDRSAPEGSQIGYLAKRATGAILDTVRTRKHSHDAMWGAVLVDDDPSLEWIWDIADPSASPERECAVRQRLRILSSLRDPLPVIAGRILNGDMMIDIARDFGVSASRVSQLLREIVLSCGIADAVSVLPEPEPEPEHEPDLTIAARHIAEVRQRVLLESDEAKALAEVFGVF